MDEDYSKDTDILSRPIEGMNIMRGKTIPVYDYMPALLGYQFCSRDVLKRRAFAKISSELYYSLACGEIAEREDDLDSSLEAYKHSIGAYMLFFRGPLGYGWSDIRLILAELNNRFKGLEDKLIERIYPDKSVDSGFDKDSYEDFLGQARIAERIAEKESLDIRRKVKWSSGESKDSPETLKEYIRRAVEISDFGLAAQIARQLRDEDLEREYREKERELTFAHPDYENVLKRLKLEGIGELFNMLVEKVD